MTNPALDLVRALPEWEAEMEARKLEYRRKIALRTQLVAPAFNRELAARGIGSKASAHNPWVQKWIPWNLDHLDSGYYSVNSFYVNSVAFDKYGMPWDSCKMDIGCFGDDWVEQVRIHARDLARAAEAASAEAAEKERMRIADKKRIFRGEIS